MSDGPYFAVEGHDVTMYADRAHVGAHLEYIDVRHGLDTIFRADGALFRVVAVGKRVVVADEVAGEDAVRLANALRTYLLAVPRRRTLDAQQIQGAELPELVAEFMRSERSR
jgi:hypothetical protein